MLNIIISRGSADLDNKNYVFSPDTYFKYNYEEEWFNDNLVTTMVFDVDSSIVESPHMINSPILGQIAPERLSGGVKALIIMYKEPDLTIRLGYEMEFPEPFDICIKNSGHITHTYEDFLKKFQEVEIIER